jgi:alanine-glyoxylate transaminase/serine-glyoxylate transaminase/serine-pyruvate transaminase
VTFSPRAVEAIQSRTTPVSSWYLDLGMVASYWGNERKYHHTAPINMNYALREAVRIIAEEGLENRFARHRLHHRALVAGVEAMGLSMVVPESERLPMLNSIFIPEGVQDAAVRSVLLNDFGLEIGGGLGEFAGTVWRVGLMGHSCCRSNVFLFLSSLQVAMLKQGYRAASDPMQAADAVYREAG